MLNKKYAEPGMIVSSIGAFLIGLTTLKAQVDEFVNIPAYVYSWLIPFAIVLFVSGLILVAFSYYRPSKNKLFIDYDCEPVIYEDLVILYELCVDQLGADVVSLDLMRRLFAVNNEIFVKVLEIRTRGPVTTRKIVGFFDIIPVNEDTSRELREGLILTGALLVNKVLNADVSPHGIYIGGVFALNYKAKAATMAFMKAAIKSYRKQGVKEMYARPTTDIGLRLLTNSGFMPLERSSDVGLNQIYFKVF